MVLFASKTLLIQAESGALTEVEAKRAEAAALLERRMSAMEAVLAARRSPPVQTPEPQAARGPGADLRFMVCNTHMQAQHATCHIVLLMVCCWLACCRDSTMLQTLKHKLLRQKLSK